RLRWAIAPTREPAWALELNQLGRHERALEISGIALRRAYANPRLYRIAAKVQLLALMNLGRIEEGRRFARAAADKLGEPTLATGSHALLELAAGNAAEAERIAELAMKREPSDSSAQVVIAHARMFAGDFGRALEALEAPAPPMDPQQAAAIARGP